MLVLARSRSSFQLDLGTLGARCVVLRVSMLVCLMRPVEHRPSAGKCFESRMCVFLQVRVHTNVCAMEVSTSRHNSNSPAPNPSA